MSDDDVTPADRDLSAADASASEAKAPAARPPKKSGKASAKGGKGSKGSKTSANPNVSSAPADRTGTVPDVAAAIPEPVAPQTDAAPIEPSTASAAVPPTKFKRFFTKTKVIVGGSIAFISFVTGVIGVWPILFRDASNFSSLTIAAAPYATGAAEFVLPAGTDVSTYPIGEAACSAAQLAWLTERAVPLERRWLLDLRNIASEGAMLALTRFEAVSEPAAGDEGIRVVCDAAGTADRIQAARLTVDEPGATALFEASAFGVSNEAIPDVPVAWNLAPGESGNLVLDLAAIAPTSGTVQVTVHSGTEQRIVAIEGLAFTVPGMVDAGRRYLVAGAAGLECRVAGSEEPCDPAVLLAG